MSEIMPIVHAHVHCLTEIGLRAQLSRVVD